MTLRQLTRTQITQLVAPSPSNQNVTVTVHAVLTRLTDPEPTIVHDGEVTLYLQFSRHSGKRKLGANEPSRLFLVAVRDLNWAEYSVDHDINTDGSCVVEDYQMRLFRHDGQGPEKGAHEAQAVAQAQLILDAVRQNLSELGVETVVIGDHTLDTRASELHSTICAHPPLCPFGTCGTMLCVPCGTYYSTCHHAVDGAEEDVQVECAACDTLVWVPVSQADEPAWCPDHTGDPSEPGNPGNPRSNYDVIDDEDDDGDEDEDGDPSEPGHPDNPRSSYDLSATLLDDTQTPTSMFIRTMHTVATAAYRKHRVKDLEVGPLAAFVDVPSLVQFAQDLSLDQLAQALQTIEVRHVVGRLLVDAVLRELDADSAWAAALDLAGAAAETADSARWVIWRVRYLDGESEPAESNFARDAVAAIAAAVVEYGYRDVSSGDIATFVDLDPFVEAAVGMSVLDLAYELYAVRDEHPCGDLFAASLLDELGDRVSGALQAALNTTTDPDDLALLRWLEAGAPAWWDITRTSSNSGASNATLPAEK